MTLEHHEITKNKLVAGLIIRDGKLLLIHNIKYSLRLEPPGGKVDTQKDKSPEAAVIREVEEETDLLVEPTKLLGIYDTYTPEGDFGVYMYICEVRRGQEPILKEPEKHGHFEWFSLDELHKLKEHKEHGETLAPNVKAALEDLKEYLQ